MRRLLIVGIPRSGTTWIGRVLRRTAGTCYVDEPDNEVKEPFALKAKRSLGTFPVIGPGDRVPELERVWAHAFEGRIRSLRMRDRFASFLLRRVPRESARLSISPTDPKSAASTRLIRLLASEPGRSQEGDRVLVKSVYCITYLDWIVTRWDPEVVVIKRHPYNVISSWLSLEWKGYGLRDHPVIRDRYLEKLGLPDLDRDASLTQRLAWEVGLLETLLDFHLRRNPSWRVIQHEEVCRDPLAKLKSLSADLGLQWTDRSESWLRASNVRGEKLEVRRIATEEPERWRTRLTPRQVNEIEETLAGFSRRSGAERQRSDIAEVT